MKVEILFQHFTDGSSVPSMRGQVDPYRESLPVRSITSLMLTIVNALDSGVVTDVALHAVLEGLPQENIEAINLILRRCPFPTRCVSPRTQVPGAGIGAGGSPFESVLGSKADLIYTTESYSLHAPDAMEAMVVDFEEVSKQNRKSVMLSPYSSPSYHTSPSQMKSCQGKHRQWHTGNTVSRSFLLGRLAYEQIFCAFGQDQTEGDLEETFMPKIPLALRLAEERAQLMGGWRGWQEWYENSIIMPPELWKIYRSQAGDR